MSHELQNKEIRGLTLRQLIGLIIGVAAVVTMYFDTRSNINDSQRIGNDNRELLNQIIETHKEEKKFNDIKISSLEQGQRTTDIRLTIIETELKKSP